VKCNLWTPRREEGLRNVGKLIISNQAWMLGLVNSSMITSFITRDYLNWYMYPGVWWAQVALVVLLFMLFAFIHFYVIKPRCWAPSTDQDSTDDDESGAERVPWHRQQWDDYRVLTLKGIGWTVGVLIYFSCLKSFLNFNNALTEPSQRDPPYQDVTGSVWLFAVPEFFIAWSAATFLIYKQEESIEAAPASRLRKQSFQHPRYGFWAAVLDYLKLPTAYLTAKAFQAVDQGSVGYDRYYEFGVTIPVLFTLTIVVDIVSTFVVLRVAPEDHGELCVCPVCNPEAYPDTPGHYLPPGDELEIAPRLRNTNSSEGRTTEGGTPVVEAVIPNPTIQI